VIRRKDVKNPRAESSRDLWRPHPIKQTSSNREVALPDAAHKARWASLRAEGSCSLLIVRSAHGGHSSEGLQLLPLSLHCRSRPQRLRCDRPPPALQIKEDVVLEALFGFMDRRLFGPGRLDHLQEELAHTRSPGDDYRRLGDLERLQAEREKIFGDGVPRTEIPSARRISDGLEPRQVSAVRLLASTGRHRWRSWRISGSRPQEPSVLLLRLRGFLASRAGE
jgi:hypothetical protein